MITIGKESMNYEGGAKKEWLVTNGLGGYASSTVIGANTRKYHGLLVAALEPPLKRHVLLSKLEEDVVVDGVVYQLSTNKYRDVVNPQGFANQEGFVWDLFPFFAYKAGGITIKKMVFMIHGFNAVVISYKIDNPQKKAFDLKIRPLVNCRSFHENLHSSSIGWKFDEEAKEKYTSIDASYPNAPGLVIGCDSMRYKSGGFWVKDMVYEQEGARGYDDTDDLFCPGEFSVTVDGNSTRINVLASGGCDAKAVFRRFYSEEAVDYATLFENEKKRLEKVWYNFYQDIEHRFISDTKIHNVDFKFEDCEEKNQKINELLVASDAFVVKRSGGTSIIAGYHWFSDWGRDTMISLPGLLLVTKRFEDAKAVLGTYARNSKNGLIPNRFSPDGTHDYNSVDASLWFIYAVHKFAQHTNDYEFVNRRLWGAMNGIIDAYIKGTDFGIRMDSDGLISHGAGCNQPLTWMDALVEGAPVSQRSGKAVEVNALWYNALKVMEALSKRFEEDPFGYWKLSERTRKSFNGLFWNNEKGCLYDVISDTKDASVRPNQILAVSLPFAVLDKQYWLPTVDKVTAELYTHYGLRSLSPTEGGYKGTCAGNQAQRDGAYHQGTVWPWLLGPFVTAYLRAKNIGRIESSRSMESKKFARQCIEKALENISDAGLGAISEIFDGDPPHTARGCISQAWSVGELLRCYREDVL